VSAIDVPASLDLLDVAGNGMDCERFLWIRALSDPDLPRKARIDLLDDIARYPGELLHLASKDGATAATTFVIRDAAGVGACYLKVFSRVDPGEPVLGDIVELAMRRAREGSVADVRGGAHLAKPYMAALVERHGFVEHERWRRFHVEADADCDVPALPDGVEVSTLAERPDLAEQAFVAYREGMADTAGDFPRVDETLDQWLRDIDGSPVLGRDLFLLLHDGSNVLASVQLELDSAASRRAEVNFLTVARERRGQGLAAVAKQHAVAFAGRSGLTRLHTMNHADNVQICRLNERLGWIEDPVYVQLRRPIG
jgi:GNAT superfamily N-acetyltransferase